MYQNLYTIYDKKAAAYLPPVLFRTDAEAVRAITQAANDRQHQFSSNPGDYHLVKIAEWDDLTGVLKPVAHDIIVELAALVTTTKDRFEQECG